MRLFIIILLLLTLPTCIPNKFRQYDRDVEYRIHANLHPEFVLHNINKDTTIIWFQIAEAELLFKRPDRTEPFSCRYAITHELKRDITSKAVRDSNTTVFSSIQSANSEGLITGNVFFSLPDTGNFTLIVKLKDLFRNTLAMQALPLRRGKGSPQNVLLANPETGTPLFGARQNNIHIHIKGAKGNTFVSLTQPDYSFPKPPFSSQAPTKQHHAWKTTLVSENQIVLQDSLIYLIQQDTSHQNGLLYACFHNGFPKVRKPEQLIPPLRYITTSAEFDALMHASDKRKAMEDFWLARSGSKERARELIREFYYRVEEANTFFSGAKEGYLSDRGMIHMVFGYPDRINKWHDKEVWIYGENRSPQVTYFTFERRDNHPFPEEYELKRGPFFKPTWYRAVDTWRSGRAYTYY